MAKKILIVDNEPYIQEVAKMSLQMVAGWQVLTASSGTEAIAMAAAARPDAILLDVMMPDMDGPTTFTKLQENPVTQAIPVILLTAKLQARDQAYYRQVGIQHVIAKPFEPLGLAQQICTTLGWRIGVA
jgi:CheY-like chemotaxis protein